MLAFASLLNFAFAAALQQSPGGREVAPPPREKLSIVEVAPPRERHALIICGHPGDPEHVKSFSEIVRKLSDGLVKTVGIPRERQHIVFGAEKTKDLPEATGPATREAVAAAVAEIRKTLHPDDGLWVICLGHGYHDGRQAYWNLPGPDISAAEFGKLFAGLNCREQVFAMTFSLAGYFVSPLARRDRVVMAATEADAETNETTFPTVLSKVLTAEIDPAEFDVDRDGRITLYDLYVAVAKEIAQNYAGMEQLSTEHAQMDDDGDGIGHELQNNYLPEEQGGAPPGKKSKKRPHRDGVRAAQILLSLRR
ncbi:MAG TPA: EF-hand domain-containing protein [Urbifossiella sp.]